MTQDIASQELSNNAILQADTAQAGVVQAADETKITRFGFDGASGKFFTLWLLHLVLSVVTLGFYSFWGKTRMRQYVASSFSLQGDRFEYTGTGKELFIGFLRALPVMIVVYLPFIVFDPNKHPWVMITYIPILFLVYYAIFSSLRYRLSRLTWRGIRGRLTGKSMDYAKFMMGRVVLNIITLGFLIPHTDVRSHKYLIDRMYFGSAKMSYDGSLAPSSLVKNNIITLLLLIPTLGLSRLWYGAAVARELYGHTCVNNVRLQSSYSGFDSFKLVLGNILIMVLTLGLGSGIVIRRRLAFLAQHVYFVGDIDSAGITQSTEVLSSHGEGVEEALGLDVGFL